MTQSDNLSYIKYLTSKRSIDSRSLNRNVWDSLVYYISEIGSTKTTYILEIGSGIGTMIERILDRDLLRNFEYTAIDAEPSFVKVAKNRLSDWAKKNNHNFDIKKDNQIVIKNQINNILVNLKAIDLFDFIKKETPQKSWDLLIANAFLDLVDLRTTIPLLSSLIRPNGLFYFTLNFDGLTIFKPEIDEDFDNEIISLYHKTMDERILKGKKSGSSRTGSDLIQLLIEMGFEILNAGSSDWVISPIINRYLNDEKYFLHFIINTIDNALIECKYLNKERFKEWIKNRHDQIESNKLIYVAHQLDVLGRIHA